MEPEPTRMLNHLKNALRVVRMRQKLRWRAKVCTVSYHEDWLVASLSWYVGEMERRLRAERQGLGR